MSTKTLTLPAIELQQDGTRLLITKMRAGDLPDFTRVDPFDNTKDFDAPDQGYQRPAETPRIKKFANWLRRETEEGGQVRMPTAILLSARSSEVVLSPNGTITLKSRNKLPLVDGQHRTRGFQYAINEKGLAQFSDYEIPVVIMEDIDKVGEMKQFRTVNGEQKSVRTDLVNMILTQLVEQEGEEAIGETDLWKVVASHVVKQLNADEDGPWFDRIVMPDQRTYSKEEQGEQPELRHRRIARATSFMTALKPMEKYVSDLQPGHQTVPDRVERLYAVVNAFWRAVRQLNPEPFKEAADYVLLKTPGVFALHRLCLSVMKDMYIGRRGWTEEEFRYMLEPCAEISDPAFWAVGSDESDRGDAAKYGSMAGFAELGDLLYESLRS
ncbi:MAG TPA: DGQHR domain-containing protein [Aggregatilineales bacterium]|nr:DGQHR domain-containing protein [Aggregatilineales bacterium]